MVFEFKFPDVGEGIHEGVLLKWLIKEGDVVKEDQPLCEVETDKAVVEIPSPKSAKILKLHGAQGQILHVGETLITFSDGGEQQTASVQPAVEHKSTRDTDIIPPKKIESPEVQKEKHVEELIGQIIPQHKSMPSAEVKATPATRKLARELGVQIELVQGTGQNGRITDEDVKSFSKGGASHSKAESVVQKPNAQIPGREISVPPQPMVLGGTEQRIPYKGIRKVIG
ncbi:MAG: biotin/lipoyl-containing protein, partial [Candidatus Diapherotrites archaeon]|nr:biotin/lipoyl-containing protein [Candidatus Diapherotrites archaeon]